uniref:ATP-dependent helicase C-terminal domain-containing protein n=1 Tax=Timema bartmani TaxID=61472 RepID=A0A7R9I6F5_9NEOP|nr:unnamed protein product [Timema bartmani]
MIVHLMSASSFNILERLCLVLNFMYRNSMANCDDYRVTLIQTLSSTNKVNPAIVFQELAKNVRCIILTSGTLTPIDTFKSELGTDFPIQLEANHVLSSSQLWVGTVPCGPNSKILNARFKNVNTYEFQDELGQLVLEVCNKVPYGVLVFLPSYKLLDMLVYRWQSTQLWDRLQMVKEMLTEPHKGSDLYYTMDYFYQAIRDFESLESLEAYTGKTGPCLLAVMRGKVAEGLDFSDNNARAIITVGIPFSNLNNLEVKLKMEYNDKNKNKGLLKGADWYRIQAFRVGGCVDGLEVITRPRREGGQVIWVVAGVEVLPGGGSEVKRKGESYGLRFREGVKYKGDPGGGKEE